MEDILAKIRQFVKERDWDQFHNPKELSISLNIEAYELLENYLWKNSAGANIRTAANKWMKDLENEELIY